jgi:hypothetical protein
MEERVRLDNIINVGFSTMTNPERVTLTLRENVEDSDGTLILTFGPAGGGTLRTIEFCQRLNKPHLIIGAAMTSNDEAARARPSSS